MLMKAAFLSLQIDKLLMPIGCADGVNEAERYLKPSLRSHILSLL